MTGKSKRILIPILGVAGVALVAGAAGYFATKTKPEVWQQTVDQVRKAHFGLDGAQLIGYVEDGAYQDTKTRETSILDWKEKEVTKTFYVYSYKDKTGSKYTLNKNQSISALLPGLIGDKYAIGVESTRLSFNSLKDRTAYETDPVANAKLGHQSIYKTGVVVKLDQYNADYTVESVGATGQVETPALRFDSQISVDKVKGLSKTWKDLSNTDAVINKMVKMPVYAIDKKTNRPIWNKEKQQFEIATESAGTENIYQKWLQIPSGMEGITTGLQLVGHDVQVTDKAGNIYDFGTLQREGNEFAIHDKDKDADGDTKLTVWW